MILATLFIAGGAVIIAIFGIVPEPTRSLEDLLRLFERPTFIIYFSLLGTAVLISLVIVRVVILALRFVAKCRVTGALNRVSTQPKNCPDNLSTL